MYHDITAVQFANNAAMKNKHEEQENEISVPKAGLFIADWKQ